MLINKLEKLFKRGLEEKPVREMIEKRKKAEEEMQRRIKHKMDLDRNVEINFKKAIKEIKKVASMGLRSSSIDISSDDSNFVHIEEIADCLVEKLRKEGLSAEKFEKQYRSESGSFHASYNTAVRFSF